MKRLTYSLLVATALVALLATVAAAGAGGCKSGKGQADAKTEKVEMGACCIEAAKAGNGCCGQDAAAVKASFAAYTAADGDVAEYSAAEQAACAVTGTGCTATKAAAKAALAEMPACCATALEAGQGCHGQDADQLKAAYQQEVVRQSTAAAVKAEMPACCATALEAGQGCHGQDADELKASYEQKVAKAQVEATKI